MAIDTSTFPAPDRLERIRTLVDEVLSRRSAGEHVSDDAVIAANRDLMPELGRELAILGVLERARSQSGTACRAGGHAPSPAEYRAAAADTPVAPGGYAFLREIHRGGQGVVYEGIQNATGRRVAIKVRRGGLYAGERDIERFEQEVEILAQLEHPNIVRILDTGVREGDPFFVMDFIEGDPLDVYLSGRTRSIQDIIRLFSVIVSAVNSAHLRGVIHRDLKPANIMIDQQDTPHLLDFGLARLKDQQLTSRTLTGQFIGSLPWASPEQAEGVQNRVDLRTDVYSLGVILYYMLTGAMPYQVHGTLPEVISVIRHTAPSRPSAVRRDLDPDLDTITLKCLAKEPQRRYQSASELLDDIGRWREHRPIAARPPSAIYQIRLFARRNRALFAASVGVTLAVLVGFAATLWQLDKTRKAEREAVRQKDVAQASDKQARWQSYRAAMSAVEASFDVGDSRLLSSRLEVAPPELRSWEWQHAHLRTTEDFVTLAAPVENGGSCEIVATKDGSLVEAYGSGCVRLIEPRTGRSIWTAELHSPVQRLVIADNAARVLAGCDDEMVLLNLETGNVVQRIESGDRDAAGGAVHGSVKGGGGVLVLALAPDASSAITSSDSRTLQFRNLQSRALMATRTFASDVSFAEFSPDGTHIAVAENGYISLLTANDQKEVSRWKTTPRDPSMSPNVLRFSRDGRFLAATFSSIVAVFDLPGGAARYTFRARHDFRDLAISPDQKSLAAINLLGGVCVWDLNRPFAVRTILGGPRDGRGVEFLDDGTIAISSFEDPAVRLTSSRNARAFQGVPSRGFTKIGFDAQSRHIRVAGSKTVSVRDLVSRADTSVALPVDVIRVRAFDRSGNLAVCMNNKATMCVADLAAAKVLWTAQDPAQGLVLAAFSDPGADRLICADGRGAVQIRTASSGAILQTIEAAGVAAVAMNLDGTIATWVMSSGDLHAFDIPHARHQTVSTGLKVAWGLAISPDGSLIAACGQGGIVLVPSEDVMRVQTIQVGDAISVALAFSPDNTRLAVGDDRAALTIYDTGTTTPLITLSDGAAAINSVAWSNDGCWLAAACGADTATVMVWRGEFSASVQQPEERAATKSR